MMAFYNIKIERELRNTVNRQVNCDSANLDKITAAAGRQVAAIQKIQQTTGFDNLPPVLGEIAALRLENPEMFSKELGALFRPADWQVRRKPPARADLSAGGFALIQWRGAQRCPKL